MRLSVAEDLHRLPQDLNPDNPPILTTHTQPIDHKTPCHHQLYNLHPTPTMSFLTRLATRPAPVLRASRLLPVVVEHRSLLHTTRARAALSESDLGKQGSCAFPFWGPSVRSTGNERFCELG